MLSPRSQVTPLEPAEQTLHARSLKRRARERQQSWRIVVHEVPNALAANHYTARRILAGLIAGRIAAAVRTE